MPDTMTLRRCCICARPIPDTGAAWCRYCVSDYRTEEEAQAERDQARQEQLRAEKRRGGPGVVTPGMRDTGAAAPASNTVHNLPMSDCYRCNRRMVVDRVCLRCGWKA